MRKGRRFKGACPLRVVVAWLPLILGEFLNVCYKPVASPRNCNNELVIVGRFAESPAKGRDISIEVPFFDRRIRPDRFHQLLFNENLAMVLH